MKLYILLYLVMAIGLFFLGFQVMFTPNIYSIGVFQITHDGLGFVLYLAGSCLSFAALMLFTLGKEI